MRQIAFEPLPAFSLFSDDLPQTTMTESKIRTTAKLLEARDSMRALHGDDWQAKVKEFAPYIRARAKEDKSPIMAGALRLAKQASADHRPHLSVMLLAVGCELASGNGQSAGTAD